MCLTYHMSYEFNNWRAFYQAVDFVLTRHRTNTPKIRIEVPMRLRGGGWESLEGIRDLLRERFGPDDLEERSIYGVISFEVNRDENQNLRS